MTPSIQVSHRVTQHTDHGTLKRKFDQLYTSRIKAWQERQGGYDAVVKRLDQAYKRSGVLYDDTTTQGTPQRSTPNRLQIDNLRGTRTQVLNPEYAFSDEEDELAQDDRSFRVSRRSEAVNENDAEYRPAAPDTDAEPDDDAPSPQPERGLSSPLSRPVPEQLSPAAILNSSLHADLDRPARAAETPISNSINAASNTAPFTAADYDDAPATLSTFTLVAWPETKTVVCTSCEPPFALWAHNVFAHRKRWHARHPKEDQLQDLIFWLPDLARLSKDVLRPIPGLPPRPFLNAPVPGAKCPHCDVSFYAKKKVKGHLAEQHPEADPDEEGVATMVQFTGRALNRYFAVTVPGEELETMVRESVEGGDDNHEDE